MKITSFEFFIIFLRDWTRNRFYKNVTITLRGWRDIRDFGLLILSYYYNFINAY